MVNSFPLLSSVCERVEGTEYKAPREDVHPQASEAECLRTVVTNRPSFPPGSELGTTNTNDMEIQEQQHTYAFALKLLVIKLGGNMAGLKPGIEIFDLKNGMGVAIALRMSQNHET